MDLGPKESSTCFSRQISHGSAKSDDSVYDTEAEEVGITYEQMQAIIETALIDSGYYDMSSQARNRTIPLTPVGTVEAFINKHITPNSA